METYIEKLHVKNIGVFDLLDISFSPSFNMIIGPNASGKTSILKAICHCFSSDKFIYTRVRKNPELWLDAIDKGHKFRIGTMNFVDEDQDYRQFKPVRWGQVPREDIEKTYSVTQKVIPYNLLAIGANRDFEYCRIDGMKKESKGEERRKYYRDNNIDFIEKPILPGIKQWMINRYFIIDKDWATIERDNWKNVIKMLPELSPREIELKFERIERDLEPAFSINGRNCYLEELSGGFKSFLSIIFSIVDWCEGVNEGDSGLIENAEGTILIDEIDAHLHPEWQLKIVENLSNMFPKLQFIVTTHSPHVITSAKSNQIIRIPDHDGNLLLGPEKKAYKGWKIDYILEELMGFINTEELSSDEILQELDNAYGEKDIDKYNKCLSELENVLHPNDPILKVYKIKRSNLF
ncbi:AAA family ATPase [Desulfobacterales bacterium HSG2]|nr:AAA family ATPase [Desulfobacterales bacterium HSG2]